MRVIPPKFAYRTFIALFCLVALAQIERADAAPSGLNAIKPGHTKSVVDYVDPFINTGQQGETFPGAITPSGIVQLGPEPNRNWGI